MPIDSIWGMVAICAILNTSVWCFTTFFLFARYKLPFYHIMAVYQLYHFLGFVIRPWELLVSGQSGTWNVVGQVPDESTLLWATFVGMIAHLTMFAGFVANHTDFKPIALLPNIDLVALRPRIFWLVAIVFFLLGFYGIRTTLAGWSSGISGELDQAGAYRSVDVSGYQTVFIELITVTLLTIFSVRRARRLAIAAIVGYIVFRMSFGSTRSAFVAIALATALMALVNQRRRLPSPRVVIVGLVVLLAFNLVGSDREGVNRIFAGDESVSEFLDNYVNGQGDNAGGELTQNMQEWDIFTSVLTHIPSETGYSYGTQYLRLLIWPIPRFLWSNKPVFTNRIEMLDYGNYLNFTFTLYADSYQTLGLPGMVIILYLISLYINWLYRRLLTRPTPLGVIIYFIHVAYATILFRDGPVSAGYFYLVLSAGAYVLCRAGSLAMEAPVSRPAVAGYPVAARAAT